MKTKIGMKIVDGYLTFDGATWSRHDENLVSWLENVNPEDLMCGEHCFDIEVEVLWKSKDGGPTLEAVDKRKVW